MTTPTPGGRPGSGSGGGPRPGAGPGGARITIASLVAATLVAASSAASALWIAEDRNARTDCTWLAVSWTQFATSYVGLAAAVVAVALAVRTLLSGRAHGRPGSSGVAAVCLLLAGLTLLLGAFMVYATHADASEVAGRVGERFCL